MHDHDHNHGGFPGGAFFYSGGGKSLYGQPQRKELPEPTDESYYQVEPEVWKNRVRQVPYEKLQIIHAEIVHWMDLALDEYNAGKRSFKDTDLMLLTFTYQKEYIEMVMEQQGRRAVAEITSRF